MCCCSALCRSRNTGNYTPGHVSRYNPLATPLPERSGRGFWLLSTRRAASRMPAIHAAFRMPRTLYLPLCTPKPLAASRDANTIRVQTDRNRCRSCKPTAANRSQTIRSRRKPTTTQAPMQTGRRSYNTSLPATSARAAGYFSSIQISGAPVAAIWSSVSSMPTMPTQ